MNRLHIMLNNRKRFVFLAAVAAALVLLAGGANALAITTYTVWTVSKASSNPTCAYPSPTTCNTIMSAVSAASAGDVIVVGPGKYNESVTIPAGKDGLSLLGAQAGNDARVDRHDQSKESIVVGGVPFTAGISVLAKLVVVDGFTVQGGYGGIFLAGTDVGPADGSVVANNILQSNAFGVFLGGEVGSLTGALVEHNLFKDNNLRTAPSGYGILTSGGVNLASITENAFTGNKAAAMRIERSNHMAITNNTSEKDGSFVVFLKTTNSQFSNNRGEDFGAKGPPLPSDYTSDAAVAIGWDNNGLVISDNCLEEGKDPIINGIAFSTLVAPAHNTNIYVKNNRIKRFPGTGILAEPSMLTLSFILGNEVEDNGLDGIYIDGLGNVGNSLFDNEAEGNHGFDCHDDTSGSFTLGTANTWFNNTGSSSSPNRLCRPGRRHDRD